MNTTKRCAVEHKYVTTKQNGTRIGYNVIAYGDTVTHGVAQQNIAWHVHITKVHTFTNHTAVAHAIADHGMK
eukprot:6166417-Pyramimonas_sp.AAC.1